MNYDVLDALVILSETIYDRDLVSDLITRAKQHAVPTVIIHGRYDGCYSIVTDYAAAYKELIRHVIEVHGAKRLSFIAGRKDAPDSMQRLLFFREALEEKNITFAEDMLYYGDYWDVPTRNAIREMIANDAVLDAIICANDTMAMAACEELGANGIKVPEDVIVTGFDGLLSAQYFVPRLSTCREDFPMLAAMTAEILKTSGWTWHRD